MHLGEIVCCFGQPNHLRIPSTVREIGENAFEHVNSLVNLRFEEGVERIKSYAFSNCSGLKRIVFPASLVVIEERAFLLCGLREVKFAAGSNLQSIGTEAFAHSRLKSVLLPASVTEIDPSAFSAEVWRILKFEGPPPVLVTEYFLCSPDSVTMLRWLTDEDAIEVPADIGVIGKDAFRNCHFGTVDFANGSRLREIGEGAFSCSAYLDSITVPSSVEILGTRCFENCGELTKVVFEEPAKLKKIGELAFAFCKIRSFTIPASVNEIDGSAFVGCPLEEINLDPGNRRFIIRGNTLLTSDWTEIVRSFGIKREIFVPSEVEILQKSCFESSGYLQELKFETGSKLRKIHRSALSRCGSLKSIVVPASVSEIEEFAFKECIGLEECSIHKGALLTAIGEEAFAGCSCLRSLYVPKKVEGIGENCFKECLSLFRLRFGSGDTLKRIVRDMTLDEALEHLGVSVISNQFRIKVEDDCSDLSFPGWVSVVDECSHMTLTQEF
jgi:hypothetical protein